MKLKQRFSIIAGICAVEMAILSTITMLGAGFIQNVQNYQFLEQECTAGVSDMINFLNRTIYWALDTETVSTDWKAKLVNTNKKFREFTEYPSLRFFPQKFRNEVDAANSIWTKVINLVNPLNPQMTAIQNTKITEEERGFISRNGIAAAHERYPDSEAIKELVNCTLLVETQMRGLMSFSSELTEQMIKISAILSEQVAMAKIAFRIGVIILGLIFVGIIFISILYGTTIIIKGIKKVRDMSSSLAQKDFTTKITPQGSNEMQALMNNMNGMVKEINDFFIVVKKTAAKAISSGYSINDSSSSTAAATNEINNNIENITDEFEKINLSLERAVEAVNQINIQVRTLVEDNNQQTAAIDESTHAVNSMAQAIDQIKENAVTRSKVAEEMRNYVADGDSKIAATNKILAEVMEQLDQIRSIVTIINSVSAQTNLLSMNAAIESAHAGEYGKGFAVVAEEIRTLAISTASNAKKITESIKNTIDAVTEANKTSNLASEAFAKVSNHSVEMINSFNEITKEIETINSRTAQITQKTDVTAATASKINEYCSNLATNQETVASEISSISDLFNKAVDEIKEINVGTEEIVKRMDAVGSLSKESYRNMTELENVLEKFKTTSDDSDEELKEVIEENGIENIISPELQAQLEADFGLFDNDDSVSFDPEAVEEVTQEESEKKTASEASKDIDEEALPAFDDMFESVEKPL